MTAPVPAQPCGALLPRLKDPGWECTGRGLIVVCHGPKDVPIVLPARALDVIEPEEWWELPTVRFEGGDHLHLQVPLRPTGFRGDTVFAFGDRAVPFKSIGSIAGGGEVWIGLSWNDDRNPAHISASKEADR